MILLYVTASSLKEARKISNALLDKKLIACANILKSDSIYRWKGKKVDEKEFIIHAKTTEKQFSEAEKLIKKIHSYEIPCIIKIPIKGNSVYLKWVRGELKNS